MKHKITFRKIEEGHLFVEADSVEEALRKAQTFPELHAEVDIDEIEWDEPAEITLIGAQ